MVERRRINRRTAESPAAEQPQPLSGLFRRVARNAGLVFSGKTVGSISALAYLAIAAHALGASEFGIIVLIHSYMVLLTRLISFKSFQSIVKYGADSLQRNDQHAFQCLIKFTLCLDFASACLGVAVGIIVMQLFGSELNIPANATDLASLYCLLVLLNINATPSGILRLFDRFDLIAWYSPVEPVSRLLGVVVASSLNAPWEVYLAVWFAARVLGSLVLMLMAWQELGRQRLRQAFTWQLTDLTESHPGIWSFSWSSNLHGTVSSIGGQLATLVVGVVLGPAGAALFRVAHEIAEVVGKAAQIFNNALYLELSRLVAASGSRGIQKIITRAGRAGLLIGGVFTALMYVGGEDLLARLFGAEFSDAYAVLVLLSLAATVALTVFPFEPALYAVGKPQVALYLKTITTTVHLLGLTFLLDIFGLVGAGYAALLANASSAILLLLATRKVLRRHGASEQ